MANFKNTGDLYVDNQNPNASDGNAGTDPDFPKLTIKSAVLAGTGNIIIVGDGIYPEQDIDFLSNPNTIIGDNMVIMEGDLSNDAFLVGVGSTHEVNNIVLINYERTFVGSGQNSRSFKSNNCTIINTSLVRYVTQNITPDYVFSNNHYINTSISFSTGTTGEDTGIENCVFENCTLEDMYNDDFLGIRNCAFKNCNIQIFDIEMGAKFTFCAFENCSFVYDGSTYNSLTDIKSVIGGFANCIETPLGLNRILGENITLDKTVQGSSLLLGNGFNGTNIGGVRRGLQQWRNSSSIQNGTISNIVFDGNVWQVQGTNTTGLITSDVIDFGLTVKSPRLTLKGLVNYLDNVPYFNMLLIDPRKLNIECRYAQIGQDITVQTWKPFVLGERILLDSGGLSTGEDGFDWNDTVIQPMKQIQLRITLRQDY